MLGPVSHETLNRNRKKRRFMDLQAITSEHQKGGCHLLRAERDCLAALGPFCTED